jgi:hypothetical protein
MRTRSCPCSALALGIFVVAGVSSSFADARPNPYGGIVDRNPFGLKPPPPPPVEMVEEPPVPPPNVKLTGISNLFSKRALLEITEQQAPARPGQAPPPGGMVNRPILSEGEAMFGVEVVAIDLERSIVRIRKGGTESDLTFEVPKTSGSAAPAPAPPAMVGRTASAATTAGPATMGQPTIISSSEPRGGVTMLGGGGGFAGNTAGVSAYGGAAPAGTTRGNVSSYGGMPYTGSGSGNFASAGGASTIPGRPLRTTTTVGQSQPVDPDTQMVIMEANRIRYDQMNAAGGSGGRIQKMPPLPPTPLSRELGVGGQQ